MTRLLIIALLAASLTACALARQQQAAEAHKKYLAAQKEATEAVLDCSQMRRDKELHGYVGAAKCANDRILEAYEKVDYPRMDIINIVNAKRLEVAEKLDRHKITESQGSLEFAKFVRELRNEERAQALEAQERAAEQHRQDTQQIWLPMISQGLGMMQQR